MRVWIFFLGLAAWVLAAALALSGRLLAAAAVATFAFGADAAGRTWSRRSPVPMPYSMRWLLELPRGPHSPHRLLQVLRPVPGERVLEVGPGIGVHALPVARALQPGGILDVIDIQREMIDELVRRATAVSLANVVPALGDARKLPYPDRCFDAAYLIGVLGEIPDPLAALREIRRVLKPGGRLIVCELLLDPDFVPLTVLREMAGCAGLLFERSDGPRFAYSAVLRTARTRQALGNL
ncbi:MAG: methyltransferase domain-containing protein [Pseudomonadota bacterium]